jgi:hypothetical protein
MAFAAFANLSNHQQEVFFSQLVSYNIKKNQSCNSEAFSQEILKRGFKLLGVRISYSNI